MEIIDSHNHLWDTRRLHYKLFDTIPALNRPFLPTEYQQVAASLGISSSICVEAASAGADGMAEAAWLLEQAQHNPFIAGVVVWVPLEQPNLADYLNQLLLLDKGHHIVGVRRSFEFEAPDFPSRPNVIAGIKTVAQFGLPVDLVLFYPSMQATIESVRKCPEAHFVLDHLGKPAIRSKGWQPWANQIEELASLDNVVCKVSGLSTEADHMAWRPADLMPYIHHAIRCFGWKRLLFGSDWPVCDLAGGNTPWLETLQRLLSDVPAHEQQLFWAENARRVYRLGNKQP
jgi:L-fuconolactonase